MRILVLELIISLSVFTHGQNVTSNFRDTLLYDNFSSVAYNFPQKYNAKELFILENNQYRVKRMATSNYSIALAKLDEPVTSFSLSTKIELIKSKNKDASVGVVLHAQSNRNGAIILEIKNKRKFRITKIFDGQYRYLSGTAQEEGWVKTKAINKKGANRILVNAENGFYDVFINGHFVADIIDDQFKTGGIGYFVRGNSEMLTYYFLLNAKSEGLPKSGGAKNNNVVSGGFDDPSFQEVITIFKAKIDAQQQAISSLQQQIDDCRSMLNYDTTVVTKAKTLDLENRTMRLRLDSVTRQLNQAKTRLVYLESLREDIEKGSNGDLVLNLTSILADLKKENKALQSQADFYKSETQKFKDDNKVLLREINRLKYLLKAQE